MWYCYTDVYNKSQSPLFRQRESKCELKNKPIHIQGGHATVTLVLFPTMLCHWMMRSTLARVDWWPGLVWCKIVALLDAESESDRSSRCFCCFYLSVSCLFILFIIKPTADYIQPYNIKLSRIQFSLIIITFMSRSFHCYHPHHPHSSSLCARDSIQLLDHALSWIVGGLWILENSLSLTHSLDL